MMSFDSDNTVGASPEILEHLIRCNDGSLGSYGADAITRRVEQLFCEFFERDVAVFPVATGTAANSLAIACYTPPWGAVYCHGGAHIHVDECAAPEFYTGGAKLVVARESGTKLDVADLEKAHARGWSTDFHHAQPALVSITQATEGGTVYQVSEIEAICDFAKANGLAMHMDGARFCNALVSLNCSPADMTWRAGIDVLSFGATKNGALAAEAVIFFDKEKAREFIFRRKRAGHQFSKQRFLSAQLEAFLTDDLWRRNAVHANNMARRLADGLVACEGVSLAWPVEANEIFVRIPDAAIKRLGVNGYAPPAWPVSGPDCYRMVTSWCTDTADVDAMIAATETATGRR